MRPLAIDDLVPRLKRGIAGPNLGDEPVLNTHKSGHDRIRISNGMDGASEQDDWTVLVGGGHLSALAPSRSRSQQSHNSNNVMTHSWAP